MTQMLANLAIAIVFACIGAGIGYAGWRLITHEADQQHGQK
jgi:hypothetical protein